MRVAIVGCGFVADLYMATLPSHPELDLVGVMDRDPVREARFAAHHGVYAFRSFGELLEDPRVETVLNLTNPASHLEVTEACLRAGKHVYSEKPLAMTFEDAERLVRLADERGVRLSGAPSRVLGVPAQTAWKALREGAVGKPYLAYAEMDDGMLHRMAYEKWISASGAPWPYEDELETGNTLEHAGYALTWLAAFFGPAESVTAFASRVVVEKHMGVPLEQQAPDFSVACIQFRSGPVARITCSIVAPADHSITIVGEEGVLSIDDCWKPKTPVRLSRRVRALGREIELPVARRVPRVGGAEAERRTGTQRKVDFCLGPLELAEALAEGRPSRLSSRFCLHITELALAINGAMDRPGPVKLRSTFEPMEPMPWAR